MQHLIMFTQAEIKRFLLRICMMSMGPSSKNVHWDAVLKDIGVPINLKKWKLAFPLL